MPEKNAVHLPKGIAVSSRVRLARNFAHYEFPNRIEAEGAEEVFSKVRAVLEESGLLESREMTAATIQNQPQIKREYLLERHLISKDILESPHGAVLVSEDQQISLMVHEEDHLRLQTILPDFSLREAFALCNEIDDIIDQKMEYSFDENLGYLTACPTNLGTGLRASVMLHLPFLRRMGYTDMLYNNYTKLGLAVRGLYGENSEPAGDLYQISNQRTLGKSEEEILSNIIGISTYIIRMEEKLRQNMLRAAPLQVMDRIGRSLGVLRFSALLSPKEAMEHLSAVKAGLSMELLEGMTDTEIDAIMIEVQPAALRLQYQEEKDLTKNFSPLRAQYLRKRFKSVDFSRHYPISGSGIAAGATDGQEESADDGKLH